MSAVNTVATAKVSSRARWGVCQRRCTSAHQRGARPSSDQANRQRETHIAVGPTQAKPHTVKAAMSATARMPWCRASATSSAKAGVEARPSLAGRREGEIGEERHARTDG